MIDASYFWSNVFTVGTGTLLIRGTLIFMSSRLTIPDRVREIFSFIPSAILPSMIAPMVFFHQGSVDFIFGKERFVILVLATIVCYFTRSMLGTICFGLAALFIMTQFY